jgi:hypothetical protein
MPDIVPNVLAVAMAVVLNFVLGFIWYTPLFGKLWRQELGLAPGHTEQGGALAKGLLANVVGCLLIAFILANNIAAWTPSTWGIQGAGLDPAVQASQAAIFTWLGFFVPPLLNGMAWESRSWKLAAIHGGYYLVSLLVAAMLLTHLSVP